MALPANAIKRLAYTGAKACQTLTVGQFSTQGRTKTKELAKVLGWGRLSPALPQVSQRQLVPKEPPIQLMEAEGIRYNVSLYELMTLCTLVAHRRPQLLFEIGTFDGRTTLNLAANSDADASVHTIDLPPDEVHFDHAEVGNRFRDRPEKQKITQHFGNARNFDFSPWHGKAQFVFVDAGHDYESAANDTEVALQLIDREAGIIVWHDYSTWPGVLRAVEEKKALGGEFSQLRWIRGTSMAVLDYQNASDADSVVSSAADANEPVELERY